MQLTISGKNADIGSITFSEIGFGKQPNDGETLYVLTVVAEDFINRFSSIYAKCVAELIRDDNITGEFHPPHKGAIHYPLLEEFLTLPEPLRMEMIDTYFVFDILRLYVGEDVSGIPIQWSIKSLDSLVLYGEKLSLSGRAVTRL
jgi:hypothetical protein